MTDPKENWNPEFPEKENPSNPIPKTDDPKAMPSDPGEDDDNETNEEDDDEEDNRINKEDDGLNRDRRNMEEDANTSTGEDNRRGQDVE